MPARHDTAGGTHTGVSAQAPCLQGRPHSHANLDEGLAPPPYGQHTTSDSAQSYNVQLMEVQTWIITEYCDQGALQVRRWCPPCAGCRAVLGAGLQVGVQAGSVCTDMLA